MKTLIVVDMQADFLEGGTGVLPVPHSGSLASHIALAAPDYDLVIATRDWHPSNHCSFSQYGGLWPRHCVKNSPGARLHPNIDSIADIIVSKGTHSDSEAYSAFLGTYLGYLLCELLPDELDICGVATEYCVKETALYAAYMKLNPTVLTALTRGIHSDESEKALELMKESGVEIV